MINILILKIKLTKQMLPVILIMTGMALLFIFIFGKGFSQTYQPIVSLVDEDHSEASQQMSERLMDTNQYIFNVEGLDVGIDKLEKGGVLMVIYIQSGFEESLDTEDIGMNIYIKSSAIEAVSLENKVNFIVTELANNRMFADNFAAGFEGSPITIKATDIYEDVVRLSDEYPANTVLTLKADNTEVAGYDSTKHYFAGFMVFFSLFTIMFGIGTIVDEKQNRVWARQLVGPISQFKMIIANLIGNFILGIAQLTTIVLVAKYAFDIEWGGSIIALLIVLAGFSLAGTALGLFIAGFMNTEQQLGAILPTLVVSTSMLGGCMWPLSIINNKVLLFLADLTPQRWAMQGVEKVIIGNGQIADVLQATGYLVIITVVFLALSIIPYTKMRLND
ncbi:MAG: ABC transporter permease [Vallitaleaceae bacterium]|jgi:ABC-2 type transport system permease protein|nr:ABC transporter permease [Vallitaleaceae bacterium]